MRRRLGSAAMVTLALAALGFGGWVLYSRAAFGTWNPMAQPTRISYCDRTYLPGAHKTRSQIDNEGNGLGVYPVRQVTSTAGGTPVYAKPLPDDMRHMYPNAAPLPCSMVVYLKVGANDYVAYGISGGP